MNLRNRIRNRKWRRKTNELTYCVLQSIHNVFSFYFRIECDFVVECICAGPSSPTNSFVFYLVDDAHCLYHAEGVFGELNDNECKCYAAWLVNKRCETNILQSTTMEVGTNWICLFVELEENNFFLTILNSNKIFTCQWRSTSDVASKECSKYHSILSMEKKECPKN